MRTCTICGQNKDIDAFSFRNRAAERRHHTCKPCVAAYGREHYATNRQTYIARSVRNARVRRQSLNEKVWRYLAEHACVDCDESDVVVLEFDHVNPEKKRLEICRLVQSMFSWSTILAEIELCNVRCANCHRRRTALQFGWPKSGFASAGSGVQSSKAAVGAGSRRARRPGPPRTSVVGVGTLTPEMIAAGLQLCRWCGNRKSVDEFHLRDRATGRRHSSCAECFNAYRRDHYRMNRADYIRRNTRILRVRGRQWLRRLWEYLLKHPCVDCGESDPVVLDCDHVDRAMKRQSVSFLARSGYPWTTVLGELAKCEVRCANCHRRRTAVQFDWRKLHASPRMTDGRERPRSIKT